MGKLFKAIFKGLVWGLLAAVAISAIVVLIPGFGFACEMIACFVDCSSNVDHLDASCNYCDQFLSCDGPAKSFDFGLTFAFLISIGVVIGALWGAAEAIKDANEVQRQNEERAAKKRYERETSNRHEVAELLEKNLRLAQTSLEVMDHEFLDIQYIAKDDKRKLSDALEKCKNDRESAEDIMNRLIGENGEGGEDK